MTAMPVRSAAHRATDRHRIDDRGGCGLVVESDLMTAPSPSPPVGRGGRGAERIRRSRHIQPGAPVRRARAPSKGPSTRGWTPGCTASRRARPPGEPRPGMSSIRTRAGLRDARRPNQGNAGQGRAQPAPGHHRPEQPEQGNRDHDLQVPRNCTGAKEGTRQEEHEEKPGEQEESLDREVDSAPQGGDLERMRGRPVELGLDPLQRGVRLPDPGQPVEDQGRSLGHGGSNSSRVAGTRPVPHSRLAGIVESHAPGGTVRLPSGRRLPPPALKGEPRHLSEERDGPEFLGIAGGTRVCRADRGLRQPASSSAEGWVRGDDPSPDSSSRSTSWTPPSAWTQTCSSERRRGKVPSSCAAWSSSASSRSIGSTSRHGRPSVFTTSSRGNPDGAVNASQRPRASSPPPIHRGRARRFRLRRGEGGGGVCWSRKTIQTGRSRLESWPSRTFRVLVLRDHAADDVGSDLLERLGAWASSIRARVANPPGSAIGAAGRGVRRSIDWTTRVPLSHSWGPRKPDLRRMVATRARHPRPWISRP